MFKQYLLFFYFSLYIYTSIHSESNFIPKFNFQSIDQFVQNYKFILLGFNKFQKNNKFQKILKQAAQKFKNLELNVIQISLNDLNEKQYEIAMQNYSRFNLFIFGHNKKYFGEIINESVIQWIDKILNSKVQTFDNFDEILNRKYFINIHPKWNSTNQLHLDILNKLIHPLQIYTSSSEENYSNIPENISQQINSSFWMYRQYDQQVINIDPQLSIEEKRLFILKNEFPNEITPGINSDYILYELKIPTIVYFYKKNDQFLQKLREIILPYKDSLVLTLVESSDNSEQAKFLRNFLQSKKKITSLRILNMREKIKRYKYHGKFQKSIIVNFVNNYLRNNLKPFKLNQPIKHNQKKNEILVGNFKKFQKMLKDEDITYIVYVYGEKTLDQITHFEELDMLQDVLRKNKTIKIYSINHDKNDLDGYYNDNLPFVFIATRLGTIEHYEGKIDLDSLLAFVTSKLPKLELQEPSFTYKDEDL